MTDIAEYTEWATRTARGIMGNELNRAKGIEFADLAQIGLIAAWQAEKTFNGARGQLPHWRTMKGRGAMLDALRARRKDEALATAAPIEAALDVEAADDTERAAELAVLRDAVAEALKVLTPREREYVQRRFWDGWTTSDFVNAPEWGYDPRGVWRTAKAKLARELEPVKELTYP